MEHKVKLTFFGGINKVGGNKVLLEDLGYDVRIFLDFGISPIEFSKYRKKFPNSNNIEQLTDCHVLPREIDVPIRNLYSKYYIYDHQKYKFYQKIRECKGKYDPPTDLDGILISHPHRDHYRGISFVNRNIPIYTGVVTKRIIKANSKCTAHRFDNFLYGLNWTKFRTGNVIQIKKMEIYPVHVDHSIPAAYGFILCTSAGLIVYTGDFRMHGPLQFMTVDLIKKVNEICKEKGKLGREGKVVALICEGTHIHKGSIESERIVKRHLRKLFNTIPYDYVLVHYDRVDWDRFRTYVDIAKKFNWKYIISEKDAYFYNRLNKKAIYDSMKDPNIEKTENILILTREKRTFPWKKEVDQWFKNTENEYRRIELKDLKDIKRNFFVYINSIRDYDEIKEYLPKNLNGVFISSNVDPYAEDYRLNKRVISKDLLEIGAPSYRIHASGHAKPHDIIRFVTEIKPNKLIPIHTEHPEFFSKLFKDPSIEIIQPVDSVPIEIT
jgi:ribonuclease J